LATTEVAIKATRDSLVQIVDAEPRKYSQAELGRILGVSRQRVHDIVNRLDLGHLVKPKQWSFYCVDCGKPISGRRRCRSCWRKLYGAERVTLSCDFCGKQFERKESEAKRHILHFCSASCKGTYAARHYLTKKAGQVGVQIRKPYQDRIFGSRVNTELNYDSPMH
jgi:hypothetical protein